MYWDQLSSPQLDQLEKHIPVILPVAATEQHGPHLPLATDRMIGEHFCARLHEQLGNEVLILPTVSVGCSEHHLDFPGTLSVRHDTFLRQITDISDCVVQHGFKNLVLLNSHGGNQAVLGTFLETFGYRNPGCRVVTATWWQIALDALKPLNESGPGGTGHAGEFETSLMLLIAPALVHTDRIGPKENRPTFDWAEGDMMAGGKAKLYRTTRQMTPSGVYGDPQWGTKEKGAAITAAVTEALAGIVRDLLLISPFNSKSKKL